MATASLTVIDSKPAAEKKIEDYRGTLTKTKAALVGIEEEIAKVGPDLAEQIVTQTAGKSTLERSAVVAPFKAAEAKHKELLEAKRAMEFLHEAVTNRLKDMKSSSPADFIVVLNRDIAKYEALNATTQAEADRVEAELEQLKNELKEIVDTYPGATSSATASVPTTAPAGSTSSSSAVATKRSARRKSRGR